MIVGAPANLYYTLLSNYFLGTLHIKRFKWQKIGKVGITPSFLANFLKTTIY